MKDNQGSKDAVIEKVKALFNSTKQAWTFMANFHVHMSKQLCYGVGMLL